MRDIWKNLTTNVLLMRDWREKINALQSTANFSRFLPSTFPGTYH